MSEVIWASDVQAIKTLSLTFNYSNIPFQVQNMFSKQIDVGVLEVISPPAEFYPNLTALRQTLGDEQERVQWRSKQVNFRRDDCSFKRALKTGLLDKYWE